jgi:hypothetical protein
LQGQISIEELSACTSITTDDIVDTLKALLRLSVGTHLLLRLTSSLPLCLMMQWLKVIRVDMSTSEHVYDLKAPAAVKVIAASAATAASTAAVLAASAAAAKGEESAASALTGRFEVRPCIAEKLRWAPFIIDPKRVKIAQ